MGKFWNWIWGPCSPEWVKVVVFLWVVAICIHTHNSHLRSCANDICRGGYASFGRIHLLQTGALDLHPC